MVIEKGIPLPWKEYPSRNKQFDAIEWGSLEVGDSFVIRAHSSGGLHKRAKSAGIEIIISVIEYAEPECRTPTAFRIWRVK